MGEQLYLELLKTVLGRSVFQYCGTEKRTGETNILKKKGQVGSRDGCLKKRGPGIPLRIYIVAGFFYLFLFIYHFFHIDH